MPLQQADMETPWVRLKVGHTVEISDPEVEEGNSAWFEAEIKEIRKGPLLRVEYEEDDPGPDVETWVSATYAREKSTRIVVMETLRTGDVVMANYNVTKPGELGFWYDFIIASDPKKVAGKWTVSARRIILPEYELSEPITLKQKAKIPGPFVIAQPYVTNIIVPQFHSYLNSEYLQDTVTQEDISRHEEPGVESEEGGEEEGGDDDNDNDWQPTHSPRKRVTKGKKRRTLYSSGTDRDGADSENESGHEISGAAEEGGEVFIKPEAEVEAGGVGGPNETENQARKRKSMGPEQATGRAKKPRSEAAQTGQPGLDNTEHGANGAIREEAAGGNGNDVSHDDEPLQDDLVLARGKKLAAVGQLLQKAEYLDLCVDDMLSVLEWMALFGERLSACRSMSLLSLSNLLHDKQDIFQTVALKDLVMHILSMLLACHSAVPPTAQHLLDYKPGTAGLLSAMLQQYASAVLGDTSPIALALGLQDLQDLPANGKLQVLRWLLCDQATRVLDPVVTASNQATEMVQELNKKQRKKEAEATAKYQAKRSAIREQWAGRQPEEARDLKKAAAAHHTAMVDIAKAYAIKRKPYAAMTGDRQKLGKDRHGRQYFRLSYESGLFIAERPPSSSSPKNDDRPVWRHCTMRSEAENLLDRLLENGRREGALKRRLEAEMELIFRNENRPTGKRRVPSVTNSVKDDASKAATDFFVSAFPKDKDDLEIFKADLLTCKTPIEMARLVLKHAEEIGYDRQTEEIWWLRNTWSQVTFYFNHLREVCRLAHSSHRPNLPNSTPAPPVPQPKAQKSAKTTQKNTTVAQPKAQPAKSAQKIVKQPRRKRVMRKSAYASESDTDSCTDRGAEVVVPKKPREEAERARKERAEKRRSAKTRK